MNHGNVLSLHWFEHPPPRQKKNVKPPEKIPKFAPDRVQIIQAELGASLSDKRVEFFSNSNYIFATG